MVEKYFEDEVYSRRHDILKDGSIQAVNSVKYTNFYLLIDLAFF